MIENYPSRMRIRRLKATSPNWPLAPRTKRTARPLACHSMDDPFENVSVGGIPPATENVSLSERPKNQSSQGSCSIASNTQEIVLSHGRIATDTPQGQECFSGKSTVLECFDGPR